MRRSLFVIVVLLTSLLASAQVYPHHDIALQNVAGFAKVIPGASIRICTVMVATDPPPTTSCSPLATLYTDEGGLTQKSNPFNADANGNYRAFAASDIYLEQVSSVGVTTYAHYITIGIGLTNPLTLLTFNQSATPTVPSSTQVNVFNNTLNQLCVQTSDGNTICLSPTTIQLDEGVIINTNSQSSITIIGGDGPLNTEPPWICGIPSPGDTSTCVYLFPCADGISWGVSPMLPTADCTADQVIITGGTSLKLCGEGQEVQFSGFSGNLDCSLDFTFDKFLSRVNVIGDVVLTSSDPLLGQTYFYDSSFGYSGFLGRDPKLIFERSDPVTSADTGVINPTVGTNNATSGTVAWTNPGNITSSNDVYATVTVTNNVLMPESSQWLEGNTFGLSVPGTATITGIEVTVEGQKTGGTAGAFVYIRLALAGVALNVTQKLDGAGSYGNGSDVTVTYGGVNDSWGTTFSPANVNSAGFGVDVQLRAVGSVGSDIDFSIDHITVKVYYTFGASGLLSVVGAFQIQDSLDITKIVRMDESLIATGTTRTVQWPDFDGIVCLTTSGGCGGGGGTPAGNAGEVQFNSDPAGSFDAEAAFLYTKATNILLLDKLSVNVGVVNDNGMQHSNVTTGSCATTGCQVTLTWPVTFNDTSYDAVCSVIDSTTQDELTGLRIAKISSKTATTIIVDIDNYSGAGVTGTLVCIGMHNN